MRSFARRAGRSRSPATSAARSRRSSGTASPDAWIVCELSSFQLEDVETLRPRIAVLLNLEPDHLDRHGTFDAYADVKLRIFERQGADDTAVVPRGVRLRFPAPRVGSSSRRRRASGGAAHPRAAQPRERRGGDCGRACRGDRRRRRSREALRTFAGVPHRIELVRELRGVRYVNDSKATNVAAALRALASFPDARLHVILGGRGKHEPYGPLAAAFKPGDRAYLIGEAASEIAAALDAAEVPFVLARELDVALGGSRRAPRPPATSSCSRPRARASTSSATSRRAATRSANSCEELA